MADFNIASKFYASTVLKGSEYTPDEADKEKFVSKQWVLDNAGGGSDEWPEEYMHKIIEEASE